MAGLPPLMVGWTEHLSPEGQMYWYNASLQQSTYNRPTSQPPGFSSQFGGNGTIPMYTGPPPSIVPSEASLLSSSQAGPSSSNSSVQQEKVKTKKEKPAKKEAIPGATGWLRVTTTLGNIFYTHVESKRSEWTVPDEIKEHVEAMQDEERRVKALEEEEMRLAKEEEEEKRHQAREEERLRKVKEEEEERKKRLEELRLREEAVKRQKLERERIQEERLKILQEQGKRKREDEIKDEVLGDEEVDKRARLEEDAVDGADDDEAWQREMAAEMAQEAAEQDKEEIGVPPSPTGEFDVPPLGTPVEPMKVDLSLEEGKALFMHMLSSLNGTSEEINPMAPWDKELPKFIHHRDYTVLVSLRDRQDAFNEWCKIRIREKRSKGVKKAVPVPIDTVTGGEEGDINGSGQTNQSASEDSLHTFQGLLESEVRSTRTTWDDFRKIWKKDRRFFAFGRDDREREKKFRSWLKELGEKKRKAAEKGEEDFLALLEEFLGRAYRLEPGSTTEQSHAMWSKAKRSPGLDKDARYEGVGSSSRRAELFGQWASGQRKKVDDGRVKQTATQSMEHNKPAKDADRALREREEAVQRKRREMETEKRRAFGQATRGESLANFQQLLVDAIRDPLVAMSEAFQILSNDGRFDAPGLRIADKEDLIQHHINSLNERRLRELQGVFEKHAPTLDVEAEVALPLIKDDDEIERRKLDQLQVLLTGQKSMGGLFEEWNLDREKGARLAFHQMLKENAFVKFWGRLRQEHEQRQKATKEVIEGGVAGSGGRQGEDDEDDDEPDLLKMAGNVDLEEIHSILRNDQRYRAFRHLPKQREEWIRNHLQSMSVPKKTVFQQD